jgi:hypothetical protein
MSGTITVDPVEGNLMSAGGETSADLRPWHSLLGPLPAGSAPRASPVGSPELHGTPEGAAVAGWENLVLDLSAGSAGGRVLLVLLDAEGQLLSASDHVLFRSEVEGQPVQIRQESIGGRFESDGDFRGTFWLITGPEPVGEEEPRWDLSPREPTKGEVEALRQLVAEMVRRRIDS